MLGLLRRLLASLRGNRPKDRTGDRVYSRHERLRVTEDAIEVLSKEKVIDRLEWNDIEKIITFKRDLITYDDVRLALRRGERWLELSEEMEGWTDLMETMNRRYPTIPADWYLVVVQPPFATNFRVLFRREGTLIS